MIKIASKVRSAGNTRCGSLLLRDPAIKKKQRQALMNQKYVEDAPVLIVVCSNASCSQVATVSAEDISIALSTGICINDHFTHCSRCMTILTLRLFLRLSCMEG